MLKLKALDSVYGERCKQTQRLWMDIDRHQAGVCGLVRVGGVGVCWGRPRQSEAFLSIAAVLSGRRRNDRLLD